MARELAVGALMCGQWPVASITRSVLSGISRCRYWPTSSGATMSSEHCRMSDGTRTLGRSARLSERKVASANRRATTGSVEQKLVVSSSPSSGRSAFFMMAGARKLAQPMKLRSIISSSPSMSARSKPPTYGSSLM